VGKEGVCRNPAKPEGKSLTVEKDLPFLRNFGGRRGHNGFQGATLLVSVEGILFSDRIMHFCRGGY